VIQIQNTRIQTHTDEPIVHKPHEIWNKRCQATKYKKTKTNRRAHSNEDKTGLK